MIVFPARMIESDVVLLAAEDRRVSARGVPWIVRVGRKIGNGPDGDRFVGNPRAADGARCIAGVTGRRGDDHPLIDGGVHSHAEYVLA